MKSSAETLLVLFVCLAAADAQRADESPREVFEDRVLPVLQKYCRECHNADVREGRLNLMTSSGLHTGGDSGPTVIAGRPRESPLLSRISAGEMPPEGRPQPAPEDVEVIRRWITDGAHYGMPPEAQRTVDEHDVIPILLLRCTACHGAQLQEAGLDLRTRHSILKGGASGPVVVPGHPEDSPLIQRIHAEEMPPRRRLVSVSVKPMPASEREVLEEWIRLGLPEAAEVSAPADQVSTEDRSFWAFVPPVKHPLPETARGFTHPVDAFLESRMEPPGLSIRESADRETLVRRVYLNLIGLPPSPVELERFLADKDSGAWERLIDRLLSSPRYGERWAQMWLDVAGYADSEGAQNEDRLRPHMWRYRDYVIRAFNNDKPFDRFLLEQLAGDELADVEHASEITQELYDSIVATGFLRTAPDRTFANITNFVPDRLEVVADEMQVFGSAVLGLTVQCARCHSHKFDPISQRDYFSLTAAFKDAYDEHDWLKSQGPRTLPLVTTAERAGWEEHEATINQEIATLRETLDSEQDEAERKEIESRIQQAAARRMPEPRIRALWSRGRPSPTYLLKRGNYETPGELVPPAVPVVLRNAESPYAPETPWDGASKTGRRLALARWVTNRQHPLTARVYVNRVWRQHFGRGIVQTLDNFGHSGSRPTHPELLDWLAVEFMNHGWSTKWLHRLILTSATWQQSSRLPEPSHLPGGELPSDEQQAELFWTMPLRRMDGEVLRDSLLSVSGQLDDTPFGPADPVDANPDGLVVTQRSAAGWRRSIYVLHRRTKIPTLLENFDYPQMGPNCVERSESIVAPQALHLLNNRMVHELSGHFADRVTQQAGDDPAEQVCAVYRIALSRFPADDELQLGVRLLKSFREKWQSHNGADEAMVARAALASYCHGVMNSAAFVYLD